jgi:hypothetical protein
MHTSPVVQRSPQRRAKARCWCQKTPSTVSKETYTLCPTLAATQSKGKVLVPDVICPASAPTKRALLKEPY